MFLFCSFQIMTSIQQSRLADHIDAALTAMVPTTAERLFHPDQAQRKSVIAIMAQTLAARLDSDCHSLAGPHLASLPRLPIDLQ